jgi:hypothetical protein
MPFGFELRGSDHSAPKGEKRLDVTLVKGFDGLGFGVGSRSKGTFSAPDFPQHFLGSSYFQEFRNYEQRDK